MSHGQPSRQLLWPCQKPKRSRPSDFCAVLRSDRLPNSLFLKGACLNQPSPKHLRHDGSCEGPSAPRHLPSLIGIIRSVRINNPAHKEVRKTSRSSVSTPTETLGPGRPVGSGGDGWGVVRSQIKRMALIALLATLARGATLQTRLGLLIVPFPWTPEAC